jgi:hypothetical protein
MLNRLLQLLFLYFAECPKLIMGRSAEYLLYLSDVLMLQDGAPELRV